VPDAVEVRRLSADDWELWRRLRLAALRESPSAFGSTVGREAAFGEDVWRERLDDGDSVTVLATYAGAPAGIGGGFRDLPGLLHVMAMWVRPRARGHRVAHAVLDGIRDYADEHGLGLHLDVAVSNAAAWRCYERYGFVATGQTRPIRDGSPELVERMLFRVVRA